MQLPELGTHTPTAHLYSLSSQISHVKRSGESSELSAATGSGEGGGGEVLGALLQGSGDDGVVRIIK